MLIDALVTDALAITAGIIADRLVETEVIEAKRTDTMMNDQDSPVAAEAGDAQVAARVAMNLEAAPATAAEETAGTLTGTRAEATITDATSAPGCKN